MKRLPFIMLLVILVSFIGSCSKNKKDTSAITPSKPSITGTWQWMATFEGWAEDTIRPATDSIVTLKLNSDSSYFVYLNGQVKYNGHFSSSITQGSGSIIVLQFDNYFQVHKLRMYNTEGVSYFKMIPAYYMIIILPMVTLIIL